MRDVDPALLAELQTGVFRPIAAIVLDWPTGTVRYHSRRGLIMLDGEAFEGVGSLGNAEGIAEAPGLAVREYTLTLTGFLADQLEKVHGVRVRNRAAEIFFGAVDEAEQQIGSLIRVFRGQMRRVDFEIQDAGVNGYDHFLRVLVQNHLQAGRRSIEVRREHPRFPALRAQDQLTWPA
ncbi:MAG: hypothetical protein AAGD13_00580 [Pseudomonadota bacterium]